MLNDCKKKIIFRYKKALWKSITKSFTTQKEKKVLTES